MATAMQSSMSSKTIRSTPAPFRRAAKPAASRSRPVLVKAAQEQQPPSDMMKNAVAAFAAAAVTLTPFAANATESGIMPSRNRDEDNAARAFMDSKENKNASVQSRSTDPGSGKVTPAQGSRGTRTPQAAEGSKVGPNQKNSVADQIASLKEQPIKGPNSPAANKAASKLDPEKVIRESNRRPSSSSPAAWTFTDPSSLQVNVASTGVFGRGEVGTTNDQTNKAAQKLKDGAANPAQAAANAGDRAERAANDLLSNPAGGAEQSKKAADKLADANSEVPRALLGGK